MYIYIYIRCLHVVGRCSQVPQTQMQAIWLLTPLGFKIYEALVFCMVLFVVFTSSLYRQKSALEISSFDVHDARPPRIDSMRVKMWRSSEPTKNNSFLLLLVRHLLLLAWHLLLVYSFLLLSVECYHNSACRSIKHANLWLKSNPGECRELTDVKVE